MPPTSAASVTTSVWAIRQATSPSGSIANVSISAWTMTCGMRDEPRIRDERAYATDGSSAARRFGRRRHRSGSRSPRPAGPARPTGRPTVRRRSGDASRTAHGPAGVSTRSSARHRRSYVRRHDRAELDEGAAGLGQGEDRRPAAAAAPGRPNPDPARVRGDRDPRLGAHDGGVGGVVLGDRSDRRVRQAAQGCRWYGEDRSGRPGGGPHHRKRPRSGSMITRIGRLWPIGGIPPMVKPDSSFASRAVARRTSRAPVTAASRARSTRFGPETRHRIGSSAPSSPANHEDQRLDDLADLGARRPRRPRRRYGSTRRRRARRG